jgi:AraC-like DNA-binding protein
MSVEVDYRVFADVDEHAEALRHWDQRYQQISRGRLRSALTQLTVSDLSIFREEFNQRITQQGVSPSGPIVTFGTVINVSPSSPAWFQGQPLGAHEFLCVPGGTEFTLHLPPDAKIVGITLKQSDWEMLIPEEIHTVLRQSMLRRRITASQREHDFLCRLIERVMNYRPPSVSAAASDIAQLCDLERIPAFIASMVAGGDVNFRSNLTHMVRADIVERCRRIAMCPAEVPITVADLCATLKISPRTLENSFVAVTGTSPASYLRSVRLAEVRKFINSTDPACVSVGDAAARWGFSTTHFAAIYQQQYGEKPSMARRKTARRSYDAIASG